MGPEEKVKAAIRAAFVAADMIPASTAKRNWPENPTGWFYMPVQNGMGVTGIPDFIGCYKGVFLAVEAKAGKNTTSAQQDARISEIAASGAHVIVAYSSEPVKYLLTNIDETANDTAALRVGPESV